MEGTNKEDKRCESICQNDTNDRIHNAFTIKDELFQEYAKHEIINGFLQKPIHLSDLRAEVNNQLNAYELPKQ